MEHHDNYSWFQQELIKGLAKGRGKLFVYRNKLKDPRSYDQLVHFLSFSADNLSVLPPMQYAFIDVSPEGLMKVYENGYHDPSMQAYLKRRFGDDLLPIGTLKEEWDRVVNN